MSSHTEQATVRDDRRPDDAGALVFGDRIRSARQQRGKSLRQVAQEVGVSVSLLSQIETQKTQPSVNTLFAITRALGLSMDDVFETGKTTAAAALTPDVDSASGSSGSDAESSGAGADALVVRRDQRERLELDSGVVWERLGRVDGSKVDFTLTTYAPGGSSSSDGRLTRHSGVEYGYLIEGELTLVLGFDEVCLHPGDAFSFPSSTPHRYRNDRAIPAIGVWFVTQGQGAQDS